MKVVWTFAPTPPGTEVSMRCEDVPADGRRALFFLAARIWIVAARPIRA